jgi:tetratricopeptide (TPR) repeat protein
MQEAIPESPTKDELRTHFNNGIPSLVLALVTVFLSVYSYWSVQPNLRDKYRKICDINLRVLGIQDESSYSLGDSSAESMANRVVPDQVGALSASEQLRVLEDTGLCLKRLFVWDNSDDLARYQSALVADRVAEIMDKLARTPSASDNKSASNNNEEQKVFQYLGNARAERKKATEAMLAVEKMGGVCAFDASLWLARRELPDWSSRPKASRDAMLEKVRLLSSPNDKNAQAKSVLAEILLRTALGVTESLGKTNRKQLAREANDLLEGVKAPTMEIQSWAALARSFSDVVVAQDLAWQATQNYWVDRSSSNQTVSNVDSVFRALMVGGNVEEAQNFISEMLGKVHALDRLELRRRVASTCCRQIMANWILSDNKPLAPDWSLMDMAVHLQPDSEDLTGLCLKIVDDSPLDKQESLRSYLTTKLPGDGRESPRLLLALLASVDKGPDVVDKSAIENLAMEDTAYATMISKVALVLMESNKLTRSSAIEWLRAVNRSAPEILFAWYARGNLHLRADEFAEAAECFDLLSKKLPNDEQVRELHQMALAGATPKST